MLLHCALSNDMGRTAVRMNQFLLQQLLRRLSRAGDLEQALCILLYVWFAVMQRIVHIVAHTLAAAHSG